MLDKRHNPPAFPMAVPSTDTDQGCWEDGMTLLDHFAGLAMQGELSNPENPDMGHELVAALDYKAANAMLIERQKHV